MSLKSSSTTESVLVERKFTSEEQTEEERSGAVLSGPILPLKDWFLPPDTSSELIVDRGESLF